MQSFSILLISPSYWCIHPLSTYKPLFSPLILIPYLYLKHIDLHLPLPHPKHIFSPLSFAYPPLSSFTLPPSSSTTPIPIFPSTFHVSIHYFPLHHAFPFPATLTLIFSFPIPFP